MQFSCLSKIVAGTNLKVLVLNLNDKSGGLNLYSVSNRLVYEQKIAFMEYSCRSRRLFIWF